MRKINEEIYSLNRQQLPKRFIYVIFRKRKSTMVDNNTHTVYT